MTKEKFPSYVHDEQNNPYDDSRVLKKDTIYLDDGRPVLGELWKEYEYTFLSYYLSAKGIEEKTKDELINYLEKNGIKDLSNSDNFTTDDISIRRCKKNDNDFWVMTITYGD